MAEKRTAEGTKNKIEYIKEYNKANYENITITVKKGEKAKYKEIASRYNMPLTHFFLIAGDEYVKTHPVVRE